MLYFYISSEYGYREHPKTGKKSFHHGIDLAGTWQRKCAFRPLPARWFSLGARGLLARSCGLNTTMAFQLSTRIFHGSRSVLVIMCRKYGDREDGQYGKSAGAHLHYEIQVDGKSVDPNDFFTIGRQMSVSGELRQTSLTD